MSSQPIACSLAEISRIPVINVVIVDRHVQLDVKMLSALIELTCELQFTTSWSDKTIHESAVHKL